MGALAPDRAADPQVRAIAERIAGVQGPEVAVMEAWLARQDDAGHGGSGDGGSGDGGDHTGMPGMATPAQLAELGAASGPAFDRLFVTLMIAHHEGGIAMAEHTFEHANTDEVKKFAEGIVSGQQSEISELRRLLAA